ncbi:hypothetical protein ATANTOWER_010855 [Ataeniobius toweri]|uniref:Uncharacterized protein n=1 Tax=Ataeniobius toweri TaxID=208326 RepID=A0ABU7ANY2_9TELE|nr:hypothetical protein [Ataeniobius toweri]
MGAWPEISRDRKGLGFKVLLCWVGFSDFTSKPTCLQRAHKNRYDDIGTQDVFLNEWLHHTDCRVCPVQSRVELWG